MKRKVIVINNRKDFNNLVRKIKFYKTFLYFRTLFILENNIKEQNVEIIINALNIKKRKKRIDYIYDQSCKIIDDKFKCINICGFKNKQCYVQRKLDNGKINGCCRKCLYQTDGGCSTNNLACKLFNCSEVKSRFKVLEYKDLVFLKVLSLKNRFIVKSDFFSMREDVLKDLYSYSFLYSTLRIVYRLIMTNLCLKNRK